MAKTSSNSTATPATERPDKVSALQANISREIRTHDVFGTMADLMGISWPGAKPSRSFASDQFVPDTSEKFAAGGVLVAPPVRQSVNAVSIPLTQHR